MIGEYAQGGMFDQPVIVQTQALGKTGLWNFIDMRNIGNSHPRPHRCYVTMLDVLVILLKMLVGLNCAGSCKAGEQYGQTQQEACKNKLDTCFQADQISFMKPRA